MELTDAVKELLVTTAKARKRQHAPNVYGAGGSSLG